MNTGKLVVNNKLDKNIPSSFKEIFSLIGGGKLVFEKGYLETLGEMKRQGLIDVCLYNDGSAVVHISQSTTS